MSLELTQEFYFESAHTLQRDLEAHSSGRVHGHTYYAEVTVSGEPDARTGMLVDLTVLRAHVAAVRATLDHRLLNDVEGLGPPTIENLALFIGRSLRALEPRVTAIRVGRKASGDSCYFRLPPTIPGT